VVRECGFKRNLPPIFLGQLFSDYLGAELSCTFSIEFVAEVFGICGPEITWTFLAAGKPEARLLAQHGATKARDFDLRA
jgi:hypothetical protein